MDEQNGLLLSNKDKLLRHAITSVNLKCIMLNEEGQTQRYDFIYMTFWQKWYYETETDWWLPKVRGEERV